MNPIWQIKLFLCRKDLDYTEDAINQWIKDNKGIIEGEPIISIGDNGVILIKYKIIPKMPRRKILK